VADKLNLKPARLLSTLVRHFRGKEQDTVVITVTLAVNENTRGVILGISPEFTNPKILIQFIETPK